MSQHYQSPRNGVRLPPPSSLLGSTANNTDARYPPPLPIERSRLASHHDNDLRQQQYARSCAEMRRPSVSMTRHPHDYPSTSRGHYDDMPQARQPPSHYMPSNHPEHHRMDARSSASGPDLSYNAYYRAQASTSSRSPPEHARRPAAPSQSPARRPAVTNEDASRSIHARYPASLSGAPAQQRPEAHHSFIETRMYKPPIMHLQEAGLAYDAFGPPHASPGWQSHHPQGPGQRPAPHDMPHNGRPTSASSPRNLEEEVFRHQQQNHQPAPHATPASMPVSAPTPRPGPSSTPAASFAHLPDAYPMTSCSSQQQQQRKRLRISRACDECRRRKTRCDIVGAFPGEPGHPSTIAGLVPPIEPHQEPQGDMLIIQPCMNCRRSGNTCSYSKRPLKRGPSKGYIKDLERRLNSLESQIVAPDSAEEPPVKDIKAKVRTEDRIIRLESALAGAGSPDKPTPRRDSVKVEEEDDDDSTMAAPNQDDDDDQSSVDELESRPATPVLMPAPKRAKTAAYDIGSSQAPVAPSQAQTKNPSIQAHEAPKPQDVPSTLIQHCQQRPPARAGEESIAAVKSSILGSFLNASFPVVPYGNGEQNRIAKLEDRVLMRGMKVLMDPIEVPQAGPSEGATRSATPAFSTNGAGKPKTHSVQVAQLVGQASTGLSQAHTDLSLSSKPGRCDVDTLRAQRKVASRLAGQEADLLMLCYLDSLRHGQVNNSALAAAVSKLGSGTTPETNVASLRRRTIMFMLDRCHAVAFNTPHLLSGRFAMDRHSFRTMKESLGDMTGSPLGEACHEVLRGAIMMGQLNDQAQSNGGWKHVSLSDVEAIIHSVSDESEAAVSPQGLSPMGDLALRYVVEGAVRLYHAMHTLPIAKEATMKDVQRIFDLCESMVVLGTVKTPIPPGSKTLLCAIAPHLASITITANYWNLKTMARLASIAHSKEDSRSRSGEPVASSSRETWDRADGLSSGDLQPLEYYRRKTSDYIRMMGPFLMFSGVGPDQPCSFKSLYLRLALFHNQTLGFSTKMGVLLSPLTDDSPARDDPMALGNEADALVEMVTEMGSLGYVLASTNEVESWSLLDA